MLIRDEIYEYKGLYGCESKCHLHIEGEDGRFVVVATELPRNPGTSITNYAERIVYKELPQPIVSFEWIEHYPARGDYEETFSLVNFEVADGEFVNPKWAYIGPRQGHKYEELLKLPEGAKALSDGR